MGQRSPQLLLELLRSKAVVEFGEIQTALADASRATAFRYLERVPYRSSYNHNGRYYTLHDPDRYDRWGLFSVGDKHFSVDGTLKATVARLVRESEAGWTQGELQALLRVRVQLFLLAALREGALGREAIGRLYVYLHADQAVAQAQLQRRQERVALPMPAALMNDEVVIRVLIVLLRHPGALPGDVVRRLQGRSPPVSRAQVDSVFARYGLGEKGGPRIF
mgnify:CR=1 FL=1